MATKIEILKADPTIHRGPTEKLLMPYNLKGKFRCYPLMLSQVSVTTISSVLKKASPEALKPRESSFFQSWQAALKFISLSSGEP